VSVGSRIAISAALLVSACAPSGYMYDVGNFTHPHPTLALCASRGQVLDSTTLECAPPQNAMGAAPAALSNARETYETDRAWEEQLAHGACTRLRDRRTDSPADVAECNRDYAMTPLCVSYKGFASTWCDLAENPVPGGVSTIAFQMDVINRLGSKRAETDPPYYQSPQYRGTLHRLLNVAMSPGRKRWGSRDQFTDNAYKICMENRPF